MVVIHHENFFPVVFHDLGRNGNPLLCHEILEVLMVDPSVAAGRPVGHRKVPDIQDRAGGHRSLPPAAVPRSASEARENECTRRPSGLRRCSESCQTGVGSAGNSLRPPILTAPAASRGECEFPQFLPRSSSHHFPVPSRRRLGVGFALMRALQWV